MSQANKALATLPESEKIDKYSSIDFELLTTPLILSDYVLTQHKVTEEREKLMMMMTMMMMMMMMMIMVDDW